MSAPASAFLAAPVPRELRAATRPGLADWLRALIGRPPPRARVIAPPSVRLGETLDVAWRLDHGAQEVTNVWVTLIGSEIARRRISARTGISIVTETHPFLTLEVDRRMPEPGARAAEGRGRVALTAPAVPTLHGKLNGIAWAVVVEAAFQATAIWRNEFPVVVLPLSP